MGTKLRYKPGSFYRICDVTGFATRAENTRKQWNNYVVRDKSFEPRNAQDFVRGRRDDQSVPDPRPRSQNVQIGEITTIAQFAPLGAQYIGLSGNIGLTLGNVIAIMMDNGEQFFVAVGASGDFQSDFGPEGQGAFGGAFGSAFTPGTPDFNVFNFFNLATPLPFSASVGNIVINTDYIAVQAPTFPISSGGS